MRDECDHAKFLESLRASEAGRWLVARWLMNRGYPVQLKRLRYAPKRQDAKNYADDGDLAVGMRVEVKQLSRHFTSRQDWPFGENFIVCARHQFDNARPRPYCYVILNRDSTHAAFVLSSSSSTWRVELRRDGRYIDNEQEFYLAPLDAVKFSRLERTDATDDGTKN